MTDITPTSATQAATWPTRGPNGRTLEQALLVLADQADRVEAWHMNGVAANLREAREDIAAITATKPAEAGKHPKHDDAARWNPAARIVLAVCETDPADPSHPDAVCIRVDDLRRIVESNIPAEPEGDAEHAARELLAREYESAGLRVSAAIIRDKNENEHTSAALRAITTALQQREAGIRA